MKPIIITILAGCFLMGATALHAYMTPVFGGTGDGGLYMKQGGRLYQVIPGCALMYEDRNKQRHFVYDGNDIGP